MTEVCCHRTAAFGEHTSLCTHVWDAGILCRGLHPVYPFLLFSFDKDFVLYIKSTLFFSMTRYHPQHG